MIFSYFYPYAVKKLNEHKINCNKKLPLFVRISLFVTLTQECIAFILSFPVKVLPRF